MGSTRFRLSSFLLRHLRVYLTSLQASLALVIFMNSLRKISCYRLESGERKFDPRMWDDLMKIEHWNLGLHLEHMDICLWLFDSSTYSSDCFMDFLSHHTTFTHHARFSFSTPSHHFSLASRKFVFAKTCLESLKDSIIHLKNCMGSFLLFWGLVRFLYLYFLPCCACGVNRGVLAVLAAPFSISLTLWRDSATK